MPPFTMFIRTLVLGILMGFPLGYAVSTYKWKSITEKFNEQTVTAIAVAQSCLSKKKTIKHPVYGEYPAKVEFKQGMTLLPGQSAVIDVPVEIPLDQFTESTIEEQKEIVKDRILQTLENTNLSTQ